MGKLNKKNPLRMSSTPKGKMKKRMDIYEFSLKEKTFLFEGYSSTNSPRKVQKMFIKSFPGSGVPSFKLIRKVFLNFRKDSNSKEMSAESGSNVTHKVDNPELSIFHKFRKTESLTKKGKKNKKFRKSLNFRITKLLQDNATINDKSFNVPTLCELVSEKPNSATSSMVPSETEEVANEVNVLKRKRDNTQSVIEIFAMESSKPKVLRGNVVEILLDSPEPKTLKCTHIDLTSSPMVNNNNIFNVTAKFKEPSCVASTPSKSYADVLTRNASLIKNDISIIEKIKLNEDGEKTMMDPKLVTDSKIVIEDDDDDDVCFITVDQYACGTNSSLGTINDTVIDVDAEVDRTLRPDDAAIISDSSPHTIPVLLTCQHNAAPLVQHTIDLTVDERYNAKCSQNELNTISNPSAPIDNNPPLARTNNNSPIHSLSLLEERRNLLLNLLKNTVKDSSAQLLKKSKKKLNRAGSNVYFPGNNCDVKRSGLRMIIIDGSNVAMSHRHGKEFSVEGLKICIDYFLQKGHEVKAFVPRFRNKRWKSSNPRLLDQLENKGLVVYTPSREIKGKCIASYDDRYIVQCAVEFQGVIVSGDNFRDLIVENEDWRETIEQRLLPFTWVGDLLMFPRDPLGKNGPTLTKFLTH